MKELKYRKKEQPTGEEVNSIVKFSRLLILNRTKIESAEIQEKIEKVIKITAVLIAVSTAVTIAAIVAAVCYLK